MLGPQPHPCLVCMVHLKESHIFLNSLASFQREDELSFLHRGPQTSLTDEDLGQFKFFTGIDLSVQLGKLRPRPACSRMEQSNGISFRQLTPEPKLPSLLDIV